VIVVGLFGKETGPEGNKAVTIFDNLMQKDIFSACDTPNSNEVMIEGYNDLVNNRIYLNLRSIETKNMDYIQLLLFLFHVCHIMICHQPNHTLDQSYMRLFQSLDLARSKIYGSICRKLRCYNDGIPKWWTSHARPCNPRLIFYFATCPIGLRGTRGTTEVIKKSGQVSKHPPIRRLEFSIEDQIHRTFKKAKLNHTG
jgi:hypothetical protein